MNTYTPVDESGANLSLTITSANYEQITSDTVQLDLNISYPSNPDTNVAKVSLPTNTIANTFMPLAVGYNSGSKPIYAQALNGFLKFYAEPDSLTALKNSDMSGISIVVAGMYFSA